MKKSKRRQTKIHTPRFTLDHDEFYALTDLLLEVLKEKNAACAKVLGISRETWRRWETEPPTMPHWNLVIRHVIKQTLSTMIASRKGISSSHQRRMTAALARIPQSTKFMDEVHNLASTEADSVRHLRILLQHGPMYWDKIRLPANSGGFSPQTLRKASKVLNIVKEQKGFGDSKRSLWRLPDPEDET